MVLACSVAKEFWVTLTWTMMPVDHTGLTLRKALSDSTCSTMHRFHGSDVALSGFKSLSQSVITQALFKHLHGVKNAY